MAARKNQDRIRAVYLPGLGALEFVLSFCQGKGHGKVLGKLATNSIGYRATNTCVKNTENILKKEKRQKTNITSPNIPKVTKPLVALPVVSQIQIRQEVHTSPPKN